MYKLLLDSKDSDDFSLGTSEQFIPINTNLEKRIIRYKTKWGPKEEEKAYEFFKGYDKPKGQGKSTNIMGEFHLEQFFNKIKETKNLDSVRYMEDTPGSEFITENYMFRFTNNGRSIEVYNKKTNKKKTEISRIVELKEGKNRNIILCDPKMGRKIETKFRDKIRATFELMGSGYNLSYMMACTLDTFSKHISPKKKDYEWNKGKKSDIESYLQGNKNNLLLVYSITRPPLRKAGEEILEKII